jgi:tetratricopeptide (TPR) repeat protein
MKTFNQKLALASLTTLMSLLPFSITQAQSINSYEDFKLMCSTEAYYYRVQSDECGKYSYFGSLVVADITKRIKQNPSDARYYNERGIARQQLSDLQGALADFNEAIKLESNNEKFFFNRAFVRKELGDLKGAIADYTVAISLEPEYALAYNNRGTVHVQLHHDILAACTDYFKATQTALDGNDVDTYVLATGNQRRYCQP